MIPRRVGTLDYVRFKFLGRHCFVVVVVVDASCIFGKRNSLVVFCEEFSCDLGHSWNKNTSPGGMSGPFEQLFLVFFQVFDEFDDFFLSQRQATGLERGGGERGGGVERRDPLILFVFES